MLRLRHILKYSLTAQQLSPNQCYYKTLGVSPTSNMDAIRQAYLDMVKKFHPDLNKETDTTQTFTNIQKAYQVLSEQASKVEYDKAKGYSTNQSRTQGTFNMDAQTAQQTMQNIKQKIMGNQSSKKKDLLNDEFNFSYRLYRTHFDKIQSKKPEYNKFNDADGYYYQPKNYKPPSFYKNYSFVLLPLAGVTLYFVSKWF